MEPSHAVSDRISVICVHLPLIFHIYILKMTLFLLTYYLSLSSWNAFNVYFKTCIFFLFTYVFTCSYVCRYMWMHIFVEARGQSWVSAILFLEAGPLTFTWNLLIQPGQWAPWISLRFSSPALRLQILVTMFGLSVGSEDGTQYLKQFTSWASSPGPGAGTF